VSIIYIVNIIGTHTHTHTHTHINLSIPEIPAIYRPLYQCL
jgi:hypothetical protein